MHTSAVLDRLKKPAEVARALGISRAAVWKWGDVVPYASARRLSELYPELTLDESLYDERLRPRLVRRRKTA